MTTSQQYSINDICINVKYEDEGLSDRIHELLSSLGFVNGKNPLSKPNINVNFTSSSNRKRSDHHTQLPCLHTFGVLEFFQDNGYLYVTDGKSFLGVDLKTSSGLVVIDNSFWEKPLFLKASLLIIGFIMLFWQHDFHELHSAGLSKDGKGLLIVGPSGSGKSSITLSLVKAGWDYLTDDMLLFRSTSSGIEAFPIRRYFKVDKAIITKYPELEYQLQKPLEQLQDEAYINIDEVYGDQLTQRCIPHIIIFPQITHEEKSHQEPIKRSQAFINLFKSNCYGMYFDQLITRRRIEVIKELVYQAECYKLSVGLDLYDNPEKIIELLLW